MQKDLRDFEGSSPVFIGATIFLHHAFDTNPISVEFLNRIELSNIKAYTSALVLEEVSYKIMMQSASNYLERVTVRHVKKFLENPRNRGKGTLLFGLLLRNRSIQAMALKRESFQTLKRLRL